MLLKTYFATSVEAAMVQALEDLGPEAMIVNSRRTPQENKALGEYEVVFAVPPAGTESEQEAEATWISVGAQMPGPRQQDASVRRLNVEVERLGRQIESLGRVLRRGTNKDQSDALGKEGTEALDLAMDAGFSEEFVVSSIEKTAGLAQSVRSGLMQQWTREIKTNSALGKLGHGHKIVALVGPAGVGKSSMIAKLAARYGVAGRRSTQIVSLDSDRIGAAEPLRMVAGVLGVGFQAIEEHSLCGALEQYRKRDLVFVDTPGFSRDEVSAVAHLAKTLHAQEEIDIHLVLSASMKPRDLERTINVYQPFRPAHFLFTRLDETAQLGSIIESAIRANRSLSFLGTGPAIPEDFSPADGTQLVRRAFLPHAGAGSARAATA